MECITLILSSFGSSNLSSTEYHITSEYTFRSFHCGSVETNLTRNHEDTGSIPSLTQWVKYPSLPGAEVYVADAAQIPSCCGCGVGQQLQLRFDPEPGNLHVLQKRP